MKLTNLQNQLLNAIGQSDLAKYFYWAGGTLLSTHYLHHRLSEDLDFFSEDLIQEEVVLMHMHQIELSLKLTHFNQRTHLNRQQYELQKDKEKLNLEFVYFPFPPITKPKKLDKYSIKITSLKDIAVNKIFALYQRGEPKDALDLYYINKKEAWSMNALIKLAGKKFGIEIDTATLVGRAYDATERLDEIKPLLEKKINIKKLKSDIENLFSKSGTKYLSTLLV